MDEVTKRKFTGADGFDIIDDTTLSSPGVGARWYLLKAITDVVIASCTVTNAQKNRSDDQNALAGKTIKAGDQIFGEFVSITLTSGTALLYRQR